MVGSGTGETALGAMTAHVMQCSKPLIKTLVMLHLRSLLASLGQVGTLGYDRLGIRDRPRFIYTERFNTINKILLDISSNKGKRVNLVSHTNLLW